MEALTTKRGHVKGSLTRLHTYSSAIPSNVTLSAVQLKRAKLEETWHAYLEIHNTMIDAAAESDTIHPDDDLIDFEDLYYKVAQLLDDKVLELTPVTEHSHNISNHNVSFNASSSMVRTEKQLPKINIKPFSGDFTEWNTFRDLYESTVHTNTTLTPCQKFYYLKTFLTNEPANLLNHISVSDNNYIEAWDKLNKRYDKKWYIAESLVKKFIGLPSGTSPSYVNLRQLADGADEVIRGLRALGPDAETRDIWLIYLLLSKLDGETRNSWAKTTTDNQFPNFNKFLEFLENQCDILQHRVSADNSRKPATPSTGKHTYYTPKSNFKSFHTTTSSCSKCHSAHELYQCSQFISMSPQSRRTFVQSNSLCFNCLRAGHRSTICTSKNTCKQCQGRHHTLIHTNYTRSPNITQQSPLSSISNRSQHIRMPTPNEGVDACSSTPIQSIHSTLNSNNATVLTHTLKITDRTIVKAYLPTAVVNIKDRFGTTHSVRVLLDTGSQCSFITEACAQRLSLKRSHANVPVSGLSNNKAGNTRGSVVITLHSRYSDKSIKVNAYIMTHLTGLLPNFVGNNSNCPSHSLIKLADPNFHEPGKIDMIIGADKTFSIFENQILKGAAGAPNAILTIFGWVIVGETITSAISTENRCSFITSLHTSVDTDFDLKQFWELEEVTSHSHLSGDEQKTENHFVSTHSRSSDGKYVIELPFKDGEFNFGNTIAAAIARQKSMERRFDQNHSLKQKYTEFMREYHSLDHMSLIPSNEINVPQNACYYLPHHAVFKEDSSTTKLRVVFDGSSKHGHDLSLNETLQIGAPIQRNLFSVCTRFRRHQYCFSADIQQMFRQIWVAEKHRDFQRIVWREDVTKPFAHYRLNTVTYGTSPAPFLSVRTLIQLAKDNETTHPKIASMILNDFYVDDILSGADTLDELVALRSELMQVLASAGFNLRKWSTNSMSLLLSIPEEQREVSPLALQDASSIKLLGLRWCPADDSFSYITTLSDPIKFTKRNMLSEAARVFDPLGFLAPATVLIKILFQELWCRKLDWDDVLPEDLKNRWRLLRHEISEFKHVKISRRIWYNNSEIELHGFCDASEKAYAAVIYCRSRDDTDIMKTVLVTAKSKAAPLKQISLPRLELCGAVLLSRLFHQIFISLQMKNISFFAWTDSQLVLHWLSSPPRRWSTFIANRTSEVLNVAPRSRWSHVKSAQNPADCASRGLMPSELVHSKLWWEGPTWLQKPHSDWPTDCAEMSIESAIDTNSLEERKNTKDVLIHHLVVDENHILHNLLNKMSSWRTLIRIVAYCYRFCYNARKANQFSRNQNALSTFELNNSKIFCFQFSQQSEFTTELRQLKTQQALSNNSRLLSLTPFLDKNLLLRVGGRITNSNIPYSAKHPIILSKNHAITKLIVQQAHITYMHIGVSGLFAILRQQYWIIGCRNLCRKVVHDCVICFKQRKATTTQLMGSLPRERLQYARPFRRVGLDYAGPITLRAFRGRNPRYSKGYICLFVCFTTKAIHLELASDLSTNTFLAALDRFCARRGKPSDIFSDNGTNFQGASRQLDEMQQLLQSQQHNNAVIDHSSTEAINWHFIPPASPHFGGLWEAGVKSVKTHLKRVIGTHILTYEETYTVLTRIEAILNSRPLIAVSDADVDVLTPAHFLISEPYTSIPEPDISNDPIPLQSNWMLLRQLSQGFWKRWHREYITSLQQRPKWQMPQRNVQVGDVVLLNEPNLPAAKWSLGKIEEVISGSDGHVRVVHVKTERGNYIRPIHKLAVLPFAKSELSGSPEMFRNHPVIPSH